LLLGSIPLIIFHKKENKPVRSDVSDAIMEQCINPNKAQNIMSKYLLESLAHLPLISLLARRKQCHGLPLFPMSITHASISFKVANKYIAVPDQQLCPSRAMPPSPKPDPSLPSTLCHYSSTLCHYIQQPKCP
jgi:hypothetical protein